jgi:hypothetical protein
MPLSNEEKEELRQLKALEAAPQQSQPVGLSIAEQEELRELKALELQGEVSGVEAGARSLFEGLTLGHSEEILGFVAKPFLSDEEEAQFEREQEAQRLAGEREFGVLTTGAELVGNIITGTSAAIAAVAAAPVTLGVGATIAAGAVGAGVGGALIGSGKSRAEFGSDRWQEDVALGTAVGVATFPLGVAGGKVVSSIAGKVAQTEMAAGAGHMFRKYSGQWSRSAAAGELGPGASNAVKDTMAEAVEFQTKRAADKGTGVYGTKTIDDISEDILGATEQSIKKDVGKTSVREKTSDDIFDADDIPGAGSLDLNPAVDSVKKELNIKALKLAATSGDKEQRKQARTILNTLKQEEKNFIVQISDDLPAALRGDLGEKAKKFAGREINKQIRKMEADEKAAEAALAKIFNKGEAKVQAETPPTIRQLAQKQFDAAQKAKLVKAERLKIEAEHGILPPPPPRGEFQKIFDRFTFEEAAKSALRFSPQAIPQTAGAVLRAGVPGAGRSALRQGAEQGAAPVVGASLFSPEGN